MFGKWFVIRITQNIEGGVAKNIEMFDTEKKATDNFYDDLSTYGGNDKVAIVRMILLNADGLPINEIIRDNRELVIPQTEEV